MNKQLLKTLSWVGLCAVAGAGQMFAQVITSLNPSSIPAGNPGITLTVNGTNLGSTSLISWTAPGGGLPTSISVNQGSTSTQLTANIPYVLLSGPGIATIQLCGGSCFGGFPFTITSSPPPSPVITSVTPSAATAGDGNTALIVTGTGFKLDATSYTGSRVAFTAPGSGAVQLTPSSTTTTSISVTVPAASLASAGQATIVISDISDSTSSAPVTFSIRVRPVITSLQLNPTPVAGNRALNVFGSNFTQGDVIYIGAPGCQSLECLQTINTTFNNPTNVSGSLPGSFIPVPGIYNVFVRNSLGALSNVSPLTVGLIITALTPSTVFQNVQPPPVLTVTAESGLNSSSVIVFNGTQLTTVVDSPTQAHATLSPAQVATIGNFPVYILNTNINITSNTLTFSVTAPPTPTVLTVSPNQATAGDPDTLLTITGTNFQLDNPSLSFTGARVLFTPSSGPPPQTLTPLTNTGSTITVLVPQSLLATFGSAFVAINNVSVGRTSAPLTFNIRPRPGITSRVFNPTPAGGNRALNVNGLNFSDVDTILIGAPGCTIPSCLQSLNTTFNSSTVLTGSLPGSFIPIPGVYTIYVRNTLGALSLPFPLQVTFNIISLSPSTAFQNVTPLPVLTVTAESGIAPGSVILFNGQPLTTVVDSGTQAHATLLAANVATLGTFPVVIQNGQFTSNTLNFTVAPQPVPTLLSVAPTQVSAGDPDTIFTLTGTNFLQDASGYTGARVLFAPNGAAPTTLIPITNSGTVLAVTVPAALLATFGQGTFVVTNVTAGRSSAPLTITIRPRPVITSLQLNPSPAGGVTALNVFGFNFSDGDRILIGPSTCFVVSCLTTLNTTFNSATNLAGSIPGNLIASPGTYNVFVQNVLGALSAPAVLTVQLTISSLTPAMVNQNVTPLPILTVQAPGGFTVNSVIYFNGQPMVTVFDSITQIHTTLLPSNVATVGTFPITVQNGNFTSNALTFTVVSPQTPTISSIAPTGATVGDPATLLTITGVNLQRDAASYIGARVIFTPPGGASITLIPASNTGTVLTVTVPQAQLATVGTATIAVTNVTDNRTSAASDFVIRSRASISTLSPNPTGAGLTVALVVQGSNFSNGDIILIGAPGCSDPSCLQPLNTTFNSSNTITGSLLGSLVPTQGMYSVYVRNSLGALSGPLSLTVTLGLISVNPSSATQNSTPPLVTITSTGGFQPSAVVSFNNIPLVTIYDSPTQVRAQLTSANVSVAGTFAIQAQNSANSLPSNSLIFTVIPQGQLSSVSPTTSFAGAAALTLQISGSNFQPTDVVRLGSSTLATTYVNQQSLTALVPANLLAFAGSFPVTVLNNLGNSSNAINFVVTLQITSLSPAFVSAGGPSFDITATLTGGITEGTRLNYAGTLLTTVSATPTTITATVPASLITAAAMPPVFATDGNNTSNTVNHLVLGAVTLTSISPNFVTAGNSGLALALTGVGFDSGSTATVNGIAVPTVFVSSTSLTAQISAALLAAPATLQIGVTDSRNRTSNTLPLVVINGLTLTSLNPTFAEAGSPQFTLIVNGTGFDSSTIIKWTNGTTVTSLATTFVSATQVQAIVPAALLTNVATTLISAVDSRERTSNSLQFSIVNRLTLTNINPSSATIGTVVNMILTGTGFPSPLVGSTPVSTASPSIQVQFGSILLPATLISTTQVSVTIPANVNTVIGIVPVRVVLSDSRVSNSLPFNGTPATSTAPVIYNVTPSTVLSGTGSIPITVSGLNFNSGSIITVNGQPVATTFINSNTLTGLLPGFSTGGAAAIQVINPNQQLSNVFFVQINNSNRNRPTLTTITPSSAPQGSPDLLLTANGDGFQQGAYITFGSTVLQAQFISNSQLTTTVTAALLASPGQFPVWVTNPDGTSSGAVLFTVISSKPVITSLTPNSISAGSTGFNLIVNGNYFRSGATVSFAGVNVTTTFGSGTQLTAAIPGSLLKIAGTVPVVVTNPDGAASDPANFIISPFTLTSINPSSADAGGPAFTITLTGAGFLNGATATFGATSLSTTFVSSTSLTANVPASLIATGGSVPVTVVNADGAISAALPFTIKFGITLTSISPNTATANSRNVTITATGTGFVSGTSLTFNGAPISTTFLSATSLRGIVPVDALTTIGSFPVTAQSPTGDSSNALPFTVTAALPLPVITSIAPNTAPVGSPAVNLAVTGLNFLQGSTISFGGTNIATTFVSATQLRGVIPAGSLTQGGTFTVVVINPDGNGSNAVSFTVVTPLSITSLSPAAVSSTATDPTLVITGAGIIDGATVQFGGTTLTPSSTTPTQVTVTIPSAQLATAGIVNITVTNPDGTVSNALPFTVVSLPAITISGNITAAGTNQVALTLDAPAPVDLSGTLVMSFLANALNTPANYVDPAMQFAAGGTSINFTIAKGSKTAVLPGNGFFSPGSVAGTLTFTLTRLLAGIDNVTPTPAPTKSFTIDRGVPVITPNSVKIINSSAGGFTVEVIGFSTSREVKSATMTFTASTISIDGGGTVTVDVTNAFNAYFSSVIGLTNGGAFKLDIPFTISGGDATGVTAVTLTLTNSVGSTQPITGGR